MTTSCSRVISKCSVFRLTFACSCGHRRLHRQAGLIYRQPRLTSNAARRAMRKLVDYNILCLSFSMPILCSLSLVTSTINSCGAEPGCSNLVVTKALWYITSEATRTCLASGTVLMSRFDPCEVTNNCNEAFSIQKNKLIRAHLSGKVGTHSYMTDPYVFFY